MRALGVLIASLVLTVDTNAQPTVFWVSDPIRPGEAALIIGAGLGDASVRIRSIGRNNAGSELRDVEVLQPNEYSLKVVIPKEFPLSQYELEIVTRSGTTRTELNKATVYWYQGDLGQRASPGGWIRTLGRSIAPIGHVRARLTPVGERTVPTILVASKANEWDAEFLLPTSIPSGSYKIELEELSGEWVPLGLLAISNADHPQKRSISVLELGADGTGTKDDTKAVRAAIAQAARGGGIVFFPPGRYRMSGTIEIPAGVELEGHSRESVNIFWADLADPPLYLISGSGSFAIRNLTLYASNYKHFIGTPKSQAVAGNVSLELLRIRANAYRGKLRADEYSSRMGSQLKLSSGGGDLIQLHGPNIRVVDSDFYASGRSLVLTGATHAYIARNRFSNGRWGWYSISGPDGVIFENNIVVGSDLMSTGGGINTLDGSTAAKNVLFANNHFEGLYGWDREAITTDGGNGYYYGTVRRVAGTTIELGDWREGRGREVQEWAGTGLFVLSGKGMGQFAQITEYDKSKGIVVLDRVLTVTPDHDSTVTIVPMQQNFIFFRNKFVDVGVGIQYYGTSLHHVAAENTLIRAGGIFNSGRWYRHYQPSWYCQFIGNRIEEGFVYRGGSNNSVEAGDAVIGTFGYQKSPNRGPLALGTIHRGNSIYAEGKFRFEGVDEVSPGIREMIVEIKDLSINRSKIVSDRGVAGLLLREAP